MLYKYNCKILENLVVITKGKEQKDIIELLTFLIEKWNEHHNTYEDADLIEVSTKRDNTSQLPAITW